MIPWIETTNEMREERRQAAARLDELVTKVARTFAVDPRSVRSAKRGTAPVVRVRQIVMYLGHVGLGLSQSEVSRILRRDRSSVVHACRVVEDGREDAAFDAALQVFETALHRERR